MNRNGIVQISPSVNAHIVHAARRSLIIPRVSFTTMTFRILEHVRYENSKIPLTAVRGTKEVIAGGDVLHVRPTRLLLVSSRSVWLMTVSHSFYDYDYQSLQQYYVRAPPIEIERTSLQDFKSIALTGIATLVQDHVYFIPTRKLVSTVNVLPLSRTKINATRKTTNTALH